MRMRIDIIEKLQELLLHEVARQRTTPARYVNAALTAALEVDEINRGAHKDAAPRPLSPEGPANA